jgi:hypothetical protein
VSVAFFFHLLARHAKPFARQDVMQPLFYPASIQAAPTARREPPPAFLSSKPCESSTYNAAQESLQTSMKSFLFSVSSRFDGSFLCPYRSTCPHYTKHLSYIQQQMFAMI